MTGVAGLAPSVSDLVRMGPHNGAHRPALRVGLAFLVPNVFLLAIGRPELSIYATFGVFASVYGRGLERDSRLHMQTTAGVWFALMVTLGAMLSAMHGSEWITIAAIAGCAFGSSVLASVLNWNPGGALFPVFAIGACSAVPTDWPGVGEAFLVATGAMIVALLVGLIGNLVGIDPYAHYGRWNPPLATAWADRTLWRDAVWVGVAVAIAGVVPYVLGWSHIYWAMVAATAACTGPNPSARILRGVHRIVGTLIGAVVALGVLHWGLSSWEIVIVACLLQVAAELFVGRNYALGLVFVTPLALMMVQMAHPVAATPLVRDRVIETIVGAAIGIAVMMIVHRLDRRADVPVAA